MTVYFDHNVQFPGSAATLSGITHDLMCWHKSFPILAVSSKNEKNNTDGSVHFFLDEGELVEEASIFRSTTAECLEWHPENKTIAIGWRSGEITTYNHVEDRIHEQSSIHRAPLTVIRWNRNGTRIVSGDKSGLIIVWKVDSTGKLHPSPLHQHRLHASISHCVMLDLRALRELSDSAKKRGGSVLDAFSWQNKSSTLLMTQNVADPISCFMTTGEGALYYMDNSGDCVERYRMEGSALALLLNHTSQVLFVVTNEMMVSQFSVSQDGQTTTIIGNAKLSGRNKVESAICVADKILATCSSENLIRFWDFEGGDHFVLDIQNRSQVEEAVICIAYNPQNQMLAGGTNAGNLLLWKWREGAGAGSRQQSASTMVKGSGSLEGEKGAVGYSPESWEFVSWSNLSVPLLSLAWGSKRNLLSVNSGQGVQILSEHVMNSHFNQQVSVVQISPSELLVQCHSTNQHFKIKSELHIDGIYASKEHVALWGGRHIEVYALSRDKGVVRQAGSFSAKASSVALYDTSLYIIERKELKIRTFQGTVKQVLPYSMDKDGHPSMLSVDGHYLVTGSDTGRIKLWDISRRLLDTCNALGREITWSIRFMLTSTLAPAI